MDNLSLIYENSLHNKIRRDVLQEFIYQKTNNKHQKAEYMVEHVLNASELEYLTEQGFLTKIGQGVKNIAKKAAPYAAAGLMAAGSLKGETPMGYQQQGTNQQQGQDLRTTSLNSYVDFIYKMEDKWFSFMGEINRIKGNLTAKGRPSSEASELANRQNQNIKKLQDARNIIGPINQSIELENEVRREEKKPEVTVSVTRLNSILKNMQKGIDYTDIKATVNKMTEEANALEQELMNIQKTLESSQ